jgi:UDPglucose 6-dehydrogenase/UDP-N-acetyl-D-galactosamine dehydrogenase
MSITNKTLCIVGTGYVGWELAKAFSKHLRVIGFDIDESQISKLHQYHDKYRVELTNNPATIKQADFILICVPTPLTKFKEPDLKYVRLAAKICGKNLKKDAIIVLESTVYPGVTEDVLMPILECESGLKCGIDFKIGYSPERVNPGDEIHNLNNITKIVAGMDAETSKILAELYGLVSNVYQAKDIKTAEAAKLVENIQRDLNIAFVNELSLMFHKIGLDTKAILDAASTKWNFIRFSTGIVGGYCIPVNSYYLAYKAKEIGYFPKLILCCREINEYMPRYVADMAIKGIMEVGKDIKDSKILIMGLTYKENINETRGSAVNEIVRNLKNVGADVYGKDPWLRKEEIENFGLKSLENSKVDCTIVTTSHDEFKEMCLDDVKKFMNSKPVIIDIKGIFNKNEAVEKSFLYYAL